MSEIDKATKRLNDAADKATATTNFFDELTTAGKRSDVTNPNNNKTVPSVSKQVMQVYEEEGLNPDAISRQNQQLIRSLGEWQSGLTFEKEGDYATFNDQTIITNDGTPLPYTTQGSDPTVAPDAGNVVPFADINASNAYRLQDQISGLSVFPKATTETAKVGDNVPNGVTALRDGSENKIYSLNGTASGLIQSIDFNAKTATVSDVDFTLTELPDGLMVTPAGSLNKKTLADLASKVERGTVLSTTEVKNFDGFQDGDTVRVGDRSGYSFRYQPNRELIAGHADSEMTFDDELHILVNSGGMLVFCDWSEIPVIENNNYAKYLSKVRGKTNPITIDCYGDSITYGQANAGDSGAVDRIGDPTGYGDGSVHQHWQFTDNYPVKLQNLLSNKALSNSVTVNNLGYSGDRAYTGYLRHRVSTASDLAVVMYGVNDTLFATNNGSNPSGVDSDPVYNASNFSEIMLKFVAREVLRGKSVVMLGCTPFNSLTGYDGNKLSSAKLSRAYSDVTQSVARSINATYVNTTNDIFRQYDNNTITNDGVHLNNDGFSILASKLGALLMIGAHKCDDIKVRVGDVLLANEIHSRVQSAGNMPTYRNSFSSTPPLRPDEPSTLQLRQDVSERNIYIPFYAETDNMVIYPTVYVTNPVSLDLFLNVGALNPINLASYPLKLPADRSASVKSVNINTPKNRSNVNYSEFNNGLYMHVPTRGWHTLMIRNTGGTESAFLDSIIFDSLTNVRNNDALGGVTSSVQFEGPDGSFSDSTNCSVSRVSTGIFDVTFTTPMTTDDYTITVSTSDGFNNRSVAYSNITTSGFRLTCTHADGSGTGLSWNKYDPTFINVKTLGGR